MPFDQERYEQLRAQLVDRNEANVENVYLDVLGIPTTGLGVSLTARQADRTMSLDTNHIDALGDVLDLNAQQRQQLTGVLQDQVTIQNQHIDERHNNLGDFLRSDFGRDSQRVVGPIVNTQHDSPSGRSWSWDVLTSAESPMQIQLTHQQSLDLFNRVAPEYEGRLNNSLRRANCPSEALSEEQRAAIYSMVYQGATGKAQRTADAIGDYWRGEVTEQQLRATLRTVVNDPAFPERSRNELDFLENIKQRPLNQTQSPEVLQRADDHEHRRMMEEDRGPNNAIPLAPTLAPEIDAPEEDRQGRRDSEHGLFQRPQVGRVQPGDPGNPNTPLFDKIRDGVRALDQQAGKPWDENSERLSASLLLLAGEKGFTAKDDLKIATNAPTATFAGGEVVHIWRTGHPSPDPAAHRAHMPMQEALAVPAEQRFVQLDVVQQARAEEVQRSQQQETVQAQSAPVRSI
ncbi:XVIPCD domain-containing protein [Xanthomonas graminis]|uniref:XVIPCD domain-containing protein n=1 Tax=Xanthomonas graminis TaxID=3390026 RepID=UPI001F3466CA|nr:XVIPCD domain-containing protein [Xanthomonas translucens]UKE72258.1 hypothetical protein KFS85_14465 [Xanthomonas translucens pv. phleipratensis]